MERYTRNPNCSCKECSKEIYRRPSVIAKGDVYCSTKCANIRNKKDDIVCPCGNVIPRRKHAKTCSRSCSNKYRTGVKYNLAVKRPKDKYYKFRTLKKHLIDARGGKCNRCSFDISDILHVHHIIERKNGGGDEPDNLELLCPNCHALHHYLTKTAMHD